MGNFQGCPITINDRLIDAVDEVFIGSDQATFLTL